MAQGWTAATKASREGFTHNLPSFGGLLYAAGS
jgi:hypothetical protein